MFDHVTYFPHAFLIKAVHWSSQKPATSFADRKPIVPFAIITRDRSSANPLISSETIKPYRASMPEISIPFPAMRWCGRFLTWSFATWFIIAPSTI